MKAPHWADSVNRARLRLLQQPATLTADQLLIELLNEAEILSNSRISFHHCVGPDEDTLLAQAWSPRTRGEACVGAGERLHHQVSDAGFWADCIRKRRPVVHNDCAALPHRKGVPPGHPVLRRVLAVPVFRGGRIVAVLGVGNKPEDYTDQDVQTVTLLADLAWEILERKRAEETLKRMNERFDLAIKSADLGVWEWDLRTGALVADRRVIEMSGVSRDDLPGTFDAWLDRVHPDDRGITREAVQRLLRDEDPRGAAFRVLWPDGTDHHLSMHGLVQRDPEGQPVRMVGVAFDITAREEAEEAVRRSEAQLSNALRMARAGHWEYDVASDTFTFNDNFYRIFRTTAEEVGGYRMSSAEYARRFCHPDDAHMVGARSAAIEVTDPNRGRELEHRILFTDGTVGHIVVRFSLVRDSAGRVIRTYGVNQDITERKRAEEDRVRLVTAIEQAAESIMITDTAGTILYVNPAFERISGYSRQEALGTNPRILKSGEHDAAFYRHLWETLARGDDWHGRFRNRRKDGRLYDEDATISPVRDSAGTIVSYIALKLDVTHETELEAQLRQAQKMEAFGQLASGVAHDFNNILTVIRGNATLMQRAPEAATRQDGPLDQVLSAVDRAARLTQQLLLFSRRQVAQKKALDLNALIVEMGKMLHRLIGEHITLEVQLGPGVLTVQADLGMIEQVVMNLVVNARDAMPNGGRLAIETGVVKVEATGAASHPGVGPGEYVRLTVRDSGCGIDPDHLPHIFEPFFTTKDVGRGTGLGLATVLGIAQQHGGWVDVDTELGVGTAFHVHIPRSSGSAGGRVERRTADSEPRGTETILIVEDEPDVLRLLQSVLEHQGYRVLESISGVNALEVWREHRDEVDLLVTDMVMPGGLSGWELGRRLMREKPGLKVLYASGYSDEMLGEAATLRGTPNLLEKPYGPVEMLRKIRECLENR